MTPISFRIDIDPHGKGRGRVITVAGRGAIKTPEKTKNWEAAFALMSARHRPAGVLDEPLVVDLRVRKFYHAINRRPCVRVIVRSLAADTRGDRGGCGCGGSTAPAGTCLA